MIVTYVSQQEKQEKTYSLYMKGSTYFFENIYRAS